MGTLEPRGGKDVEGVLRGFETRCPPGKNTKIPCFQAENVVEVGCKAHNTYPGGKLRRLRYVFLNLCTPNQLRAGAFLLQTVLPRVCPYLLSLRLLQHTQGLGSEGRRSHHEGAPTAGVYEASKCCTDSRLAGRTLGVHVDALCNLCDDHGSDTAVLLGATGAEGWGVWPQ